MIKKRKKTRPLSERRIELNEARAKFITRLAEFYSTLTTEELVEFLKTPVDAKLSITAHKMRVESALVVLKERGIVGEKVPVEGDVEGVWS